MSAREWANDLVLGFRLAVGGGRTSRTGIIRLIMSAIGIGVAVAVLLTAASINHIVAERTARTEASTATYAPRPGVAPLYTLRNVTYDHDETIYTEYMIP